MHLAKWTRNLKGVVIPREILHGNGEHTNLRVSNVGVGEERGAASFRNIQRVAAHREGAGFVRRTEGLTVRADELDIARRAEHRAGDVDVRASVFPSLEVCWSLRDGLRLLPKRLVDSLEQLIADDDVDDHRSKHDGEADRGRGDDGEARPEAHFSRRA